MRGQIIKSVSGFYYVFTEGQVFQCRGRGIFRKNKITPLVGDFVEFEADNEAEGYVLDIDTRKNELIRPPIANVDQAILVFSALEPGFSPLLLDRFLIQVESNNIKPIICISKIDLLDEGAHQEIQYYIEEYEKIGYTVLQTSASSSEGLEKLEPFLRDHVSVFAGQSGVGKSSLLNALIPDLKLKTDQISSHLGRGKHTTRHVELITYGSGLIADTPGFSALDFTEIESDELPFYFPEIKEVQSDCKFRGCSHTAEPKCAVKAAVENGTIAEFRYTHYVSFLEEIKDRKPRY